MLIWPRLLSAELPQASQAASYPNNAFIYNFTLKGLKSATGPMMASAEA